MKNKYTQKEIQAKYRLHSKVKKEGYRLVVKEKTIFVPYHRKFDLSKSAKRLTNQFGYVMQVEIANNTEIINKYLIDTLEKSNAFLNKGLTIKNKDFDIIFDAVQVIDETLNL